MSDTINLDNKEKIDILFKNYLDVNNTDENKKWYEEQLLEFNTYIKDENIFADNIPKIPEWTYILRAEDVSLSTSDFIDYSYNPNSNANNILNNSIIEDKTRLVRRFKKLKLESINNTSNPGQSWIKFDDNSNNVLKDAIQFNYNNYYNNYNELIQPYQYFLNSEHSLNDGDIIFNDETGGNWIFNIQSGIIFFSDFENFQIYANSGIIPERNKINDISNSPLLTFYKYIGRKGFSSNLNILQIVNNNYNTDLSNIIITSISYEIINDISLNIKSLKANSKYKISLNFNYLSSNYIDTLLEIALCYKIDNGNEIIIGEYILGTENTNFNYQLFSNSFYEDINCDLNKYLNFYIKAKIQTQFNNQEIYDNLNNLHKPVIYFKRQGNTFIVEEINN